ncbi:TonB-dependent siderophore receptor [Amaricoccus sp.]|uniref:TonB-dependent siderophore receptor n=1 Tax=Amaricoccus sp. TaxID=1872485 RepID=UPI001B43BB7A|nr:TonB-dependent siderophore receptor [Amaricoccus sp.]MBP7001464.1 TonB-dependent siderophore receptor [Amaricoccus sp.]
MRITSRTTTRRPSAALLLGAAWALSLQPSLAQEVGTETEEAAVAGEEQAGLAEGSMVLDTIAVTAAPGTTTEDTGSWTTEWMRSATGLPLSQRETPQSTSVITDAQMKDRNITSVSETMDAATGVTVLPFDSERQNYFARGFAIDAYQYDGVPIPRDGVWQFGDNNADMILYDHVEIVRGATGLMQGAGEPGASINFIRKRPTSFVRREVAAALAYPTGGRMEADISGPLNESGTIRGRLLGAADAREGTLDRYFKERYVGYGALEVDLTDTTLLNLGISYQETDADNATWGGLPPWYADGSLIDWDKGFNLGADWTYIDTQRTEAFASVEHVFENGWTGRIVYTFARNDFQGNLGWFPAQDPVTYATTFIDPVTGEGVYASGAGYFDGGYTQNSLNAVVNGDYQAFGRTHAFVVGLFGSKGEGDYDQHSADMGGVPIGDVFEWDGSWPKPDFDDEPGKYTSETRQLGLYATTQFHATDALAIIAGARVNWWDGESDDTWSDPSSYEFKGVVTPYLGFTYDFNDTYTAYGSITSIYKPQLAQDIDRQYLDPTFGWNYELGVKAGLFGGAMYAAAAVFQTNQKDVAEWAGEAIAPDGAPYSYYELIDGTTTRGFELEAAGAINARWNASFGYTYATSEDDNGDEVNSDTPRHTLKAATDYRIAGILDERLTVGGAVRWQSAIDSMPWDGGLPNIEQDAYAVFDLNASYDVTETSVLTLSVNNVLDEKYYASTGFYNTVLYGDGIGAELMLRSRF